MTKLQKKIMDSDTLKGHSIIAAAVAVAVGFGYAKYAGIGLLLFVGLAFATYLSVILSGIHTEIILRNLERNPPETTFYNTEADMLIGLTSCILALAAYLFQMDSWLCWGLLGYGVSGLVIPGLDWWASARMAKKVAGETHQDLHRSL